MLTLQTLVTIGLVLPKQTMGVFKTVLQKRRQIEPQKLGNQWLNLDGIIIRKPRQQQQALRKPQIKFPLTKKTKRTMVNT
ncbi:hypothetical protein [Fructilactobacillus florum]|uniref:hypothetical protein n=1 Tax=Fructilactobacillus florum TaxID=640331 RepID=UPI0006D08996|nr:hypothetical protein [Fructilactobacillus florum]